MTDEEFAALDMGDIVVGSTTGGRYQIVEKLDGPAVGYHAVSMDDQHNWGNQKFLLSVPAQCKHDPASGNPTQHGFETGYKAPDNVMTGVPPAGLPPLGLTPSEQKRWQTGFEQGHRLAQRHRSDYILTELALIEGVLLDDTIAVQEENPLDDLP